MRTANFKHEISRDQKAVAISRGVPPRWKGRRYIELAPTRAMLTLPREEFEAAYRSEILAALDPKRVYEELKDSIILCWEAPGVYCHRRIVAEWLEAECGVTIPEYGYERGDTQASASMPDKLAKKSAKRSPQALLF